MSTFRLITILLAATIALGCTTPRFLSKNAIKQGQTVMDIHQQQVLDNLAKFVYDPNSLPSFAHVSGGTSEATDLGQASSTLTYIPAGFERFTLGGITGSRTAKANWTLVPVTDPRKLELMRCAFQKAVADCGAGGPSAACPDCTKRFNSFYAGKPYKSELVAVRPDCKLQPKIELGNLVPDPTDPRSAGTVTSECINPGCCRWFSYGPKECVPKDCGCIYVGSYCGTYVWVTSSEGRDELSKLTLAILDYAQNASRQLPTKEVVAYLTADGRPSTAASANVVIKTNIAAADVSASVIQPDVDARKKIQDCLRENWSADINSMQAEAARAPAVERGPLEAEIMNERERQSMEYIEALPAPLFVPQQPAQPEIQLDWGPGVLQFEQQLELLR